MKRIFSNTILATTIFGMTAVPVFAAVGPAPYHLKARGSVQAYHADIFGDARIHLAQETDGGNGDEEGGEEEGGYGGDNDDDESSQRFSTMANAGNASKIIKLITDGENYCRLLDTSNKIDCLAEVYQSAARSLSSEGDESAVKAALNKAAGQLDRIVRDNLDQSATLKRPRVKTRKVTRTASRPLRAIKKANIPAANRRAEAVVTELSTVLLRSAGNTAKNKNYYAKIAQAVDSNKVLLRS